MTALSGPLDDIEALLPKIDALYAVAPRMTPADLDGFFKLAKRVLSEADPARELADNERWAATIYGKVRDHSDVLREAVRETLVMLAVHGDYLFGQRLGTGAAERAGSLDCGAPRATHHRHT